MHRHTNPLKEGKSGNQIVILKTQTKTTSRSDI